MNAARRVLALDPLRFSPFSLKGARLTHMGLATYRCRFAVTGVQRINRKGIILWRLQSSPCIN